jgi:uncharacterized membrane protein
MSVVLPDWLHTGPTVLAAFLASLVEFVEALTIVLAVGTSRGWRWSLFGAGAAGAALVLLVVLLGPSLTLIPLDAARLIIGLLLLLFGIRWLRKAILRAAGLIPLHDETAAFAKASRAMAGGGRFGGWDAVAFGASFKIVMLEGIEVVFIVIAIGGAGGLLLPASLGAAAALLVVVALGFVLHRPVASLPENSLKFTVGILLTGFGSFWIGEGIGLDWPGGDWAIPALLAGFAATALGLVPLARGAAAH